MQSLSEAHSDSSAVTTAAADQPQDPDAHLTHAEADAEEEANAAAASAERKQEIPAETDTELMDTEPLGQTPSESSCNTAGMDADTAAKLALSPDTNTKLGSAVPKARKQVKNDGRKYVPSKKAMVDPLKMDMSRPLDDILASSQLSLQCIDCHIIFSDLKSKERHLKLNHPSEYEQCILRNALFACYVCDHHFTNSAELMAHQKAHTEKKPFKCPLCSQAFKKSKELTDHKKNHFGLDGYACTECGKPCKTMTLLKYHQRKHTGDRPYICKECGKRFSTCKAMQKHMDGHSEQTAAPGEKNSSNTQPRKNNGASTQRYPCCVCKATFKSFKTRRHHMKTKHNLVPAKDSNALSAGLQEKQNTPIITPISISQPALLQVEANGCLQKVDANIDTEQIRKLIESMGNIQKVNQVVILGQVPPNAPPLEVQQVSPETQPVNLNLSPPQVDFLGLKQTEAKTLELDPLNNTCSSMEQTIILEPITPDGQLVNPSFSELGSQLPVGGNIELTFIQADQTEGQMMNQILQQPEYNEIHTDLMDPMICQSEADNLKHDLEQTVILELTPALTPTMELEQSQGEIQSPSLLPTSELETPSQTADKPSGDEPDASLVVPQIPSPVHLKVTSQQPEHKDVSSSSLASPLTQTQSQIESESNPKEEVSSTTQTVNEDQGQPVLDCDTVQGLEEKDEQKQCESESVLDGNDTVSKVEDPSAVEQVKAQPQTKQASQTSESLVNVMSAQELVKVRKRKPARACLFQGHVQDLVGSMSGNDFLTEAKPAKRQRTKKSHLVVKFGPPNEEKKNMKQKKLSQHCEPVQENALKGKMPKTNLSEKKVASQKKGRKGKKSEVEHALPSTEIKSASSIQPSQEIKEDARKSKMKKQKEAAKGVSKCKAVASPMFKKKKQAKAMQKDQPKNAKGRKTKKSLTAEETVKKADSPGSHIKQDSLLLLKGHKQPQLKVYKLDPSKTSGQASEVLPQDSETSPQSNVQKVKHSRSEPTSEVKKKVGRPKKNKKALSLLPSLQASHKPAVTLPTKPKTTRNRKASSKVETEGVITSSQSKRALECKDCGERFSEVSSLQKHKTTVHIVESPSLTYTNGNIFEGVSSLDLYQLQKDHMDVGVVNPATGWDTEPEMGEMSAEDRERNVSFPALIPSPSLPVPPADTEMRMCQDKVGSETVTNHQPHSLKDGLSSSVPMENCATQMNFTSKFPLSSSTQTKTSETVELLASDENRQGEGSPENLPNESEIQGTTDEDIKEDLVLEVDLVTVGEQNEKDSQTCHEDLTPHNESNGSCCSEGPENVNNETTEKGLSLQTVSCSTHQMEIKDEEEEMLVQKKKEGEKGCITRSAMRGKRRATGCLKRDMASKRILSEDTVTQTESEVEQEECKVVYEKHPVASNSEILNRETAAENHPEPGEETALIPSLSPSCSTLENCPEEQVVLELQSVTTSVQEVMNGSGLQEGPHQDRDSDQSPGIILEKFLTSGQRPAANQEPFLMTRSRQRHVMAADAENGCHEIKVENTGTSPLQVVQACQNRQSASVQPPQHGDVRSVLVKEESLALNDTQTSNGTQHIRWNVEPVSNENTFISSTERGETPRNCCNSPEFNTSQCIFYPVKEEEREVLLGATHSNRGSVTPEGSSDGNQTTECDLYKTSHFSQDNQESEVHSLASDQGVNDFINRQDCAWQHPPDLRDFLLQSSDEEDAAGFELPDHQLDSEAEVMAYFNRSQTNSTQLPGPTSQNVPASSSLLQTNRDENRRRKPIDYFCRYFDWDTWEEFAKCTNKLSNMPNTVTSREVACFVGIHIAMGTLKFPSPRLYWEDLTKVPLISEAMPLSRFLQLTRMLKLSFTSKEAADSDVQAAAHDCDFQHAQQSTSPSPSRQSVTSDRTSDLNGSQTHTDPLWKVQPILRRFTAGCQSLRREGEYAVDQYPLPLTGRLHSNKPSLHCTTLIGFGGLLLHADLKLDLSDKEDIVEKMASKGSMVFLCKQELSTPAMLERLLAAGVHAAGRVGGARGQIGDEFVSSDGKLMLRRTHRGFILSTAGSGHRNMAFLTDSFEKAQMSARLNRDLQNLYGTPLTSSAPTCWPHAVLWYLADVALVNSWLLYRQDHRAESALLTLMAFRLEVSKALILSSGSDTQDSAPPQPPKETPCATNETPHPIMVEESPLPDAATRFDGSGHWPEQLAEGEGGRCRFGNCQRTSRVLCLKCCVFLCISRNHNCFLNFHSQEISSKE